MAERIKYWDIIKGIAILLVFIGHAFYDISHPISLIIYSFHMPLFMIVSGYFFFFTLKKDTWYIIRSKFVATMIPVFLTTFLLFFEKFDPDLNLIGHLKAYWGLSIRNLWFLWAYFINAMIVLVVCRCVKNEPWRLILLSLIFVIFLLTPDYWEQTGTKFMFPCFVFGYYMNAHSLPELEKRHPFIVSIICITVYIALFLAFRIDYTFYYSKVYIFNGYYPPVKMLLVNLYRVGIGIFGSLALMCIVHNLMSLSKRPVGRNNILAVIGSQTLGMYITHIYLNHYFDKYSLYKCSANDWGYIIVYTIIMTVLSYSLTAAYNLSKPKLKKMFRRG